MVRQPVPRVLMLFLVFAIVSVYLPISAAKFFFLGSAGFALLAADADRAGARRRAVPDAPADGRASSRTGGASHGVPARRSRSATSSCSLLVVGPHHLPERLVRHRRAGSRTTPRQATTSRSTTPCRRPCGPRPSSPRTSTSGAAGTELDTPTQYDEAGYNWLAQQDQNLPGADRPAFISWWDYGFQAVAQGLHPTVADNFQNGIDPSGNFLLSQNESLAIGILTTTLLVGRGQQSTGQPYLPAPLNAILAPTA